ncbi:hypothetical protein [Sphingomonas faeni]|uniref:hypothetical protein n=1 Tax=Sphingomonas faeni TaxID=185950 RepID=UPI003363027C
MMYAYLAMIGWCGTKWPGWWFGPHPGPDPEPWWSLAIGVIGMIGGIIAVGAFRPMLPEGLTAITTTAFFGGTFAATAVGAIVALRQSTVVNRAG